MAKSIDKIYWKFNSTEDRSKRIILVGTIDFLNFQTKLLQKHSNFFELVL